MKYFQLSILLSNLYIGFAFLILKQTLALLGLAVMWLIIALMQARSELNESKKRNMRM